MLLEVIAISVDDVERAVSGGADRIELIARMEEGGLTPEMELVREAVRISPIPVRVMIRPHSRSFCYSDAELEQIAEDIAAVREAGAAGVVLGTLTADGRVDEPALERLLAAAGDLPVTFHRAIDEARDLEEALEVILRYPQIDRVLTSGGQASAIDGADVIARLVRRTKGTHLHVMAGSGLTPENLTGFLAAAGVREVHFGRAVRAGQSVEGPVDPEAVKAVKQIIKKPESLR